MTPSIRTSLCTAAVLTLVACGGSDEPRLTGLAATGAAIANADVTARCVAGTPLTGKTDANGVFSLTLSATHTAPCMLEVVNGSARLYSFATQPGRVNITPATDLVVANALKGDPATVFAGFGKETATDIGAGLDAAKTYVKSQLKAITGTDYTGDPMADTLVVGDANDKVLDALGSAMTQASKSLGDLRTGAVTGQTLTEIVPKPSGGTGGGGTGGGTGGDTCSAPSVTLPFAASTAGGPFTNAQQVCLAASTTSLTIAGTTLTNPVQNTVVTAPYAAYTFTGSAAKFEVVFKDGALYEVNVTSTDGSTFYGQLAADTGGTGGGGTTPNPTTPASFFGSGKTAADVSFLNGQSFTGTNCSVSFANGTMTVTDTANNRTASASFSGDAFDRIVPAAGRAQIDFEVGDGLQVINGKAYPATGTASSQGRLQIADYTSAQATVLEAYVNAYNGSGTTTGAACRNLNKPLTTWVRPPLSTGSLGLIDSYSTDTMQTLSATQAAKLAGSYTGSMGAYKKVQLKPTFSVVTNLTQKACTLAVDTQGKATLSVEGGVPTTIDLVGKGLMFHGGIALPLGTASTDTEYVKGYAIGSVAQTLLTWADGAAYQGPGSLNDYSVTATDGSYREEYTCVFK